MAEESTSRSHKKAKLKARRKEIPDELILEYRQKNLTHEQIAKICGIARETVSRRLAKMDLAGLDIFKKHESDVLINKRKKILESIKEEDIEKASLSQKTVAYAILVDKQRLINDQSTANIANVHADIKAIRELAREREERKRQAMEWEDREFRKETTL